MLEKNHGIHGENPKSAGDVALKRLWEMRDSSPIAEEYYNMAEKLIRQQEIRKQAVMFEMLCYEDRWRTDPLQLQSKFIDPIMYFHWRTAAEDLAEFLRKVADWLENL